VVAVPVILAVCFLMVVAWAGGELRLWFIIPPLTILGALQLAVAIRALQPARVSVLSLAILGIVELALGIESKCLAEMLGSLPLAPACQVCLR